MFGIVAAGAASYACLLLLILGKRGIESKVSFLLYWTPIYVCLSSSWNNRTDKKWKKEWQRIVKSIQEQPNLSCFFRVFGLGSFFVSEMAGII